MFPVSLVALLLLALAQSIHVARVRSILVRRATSWNGLHEVTQTKHETRYHRNDFEAKQLYS